MNNDKYTAYSLNEIKRINGDVPLISKIKIGTQYFNINTIKDWEENHPAHQAYIYGRTHYYADEVSFSNEEINKMITDSSNEYYTLCRHDFIESNNNWLPEIPWFSEDKSYDITLEQYQYKDGKFGNLIKNFDQALAELFQPEAIRDFNFEVDSLGLCLRYEENLGFNLTWSVEETAFKLLIKPKFNTSYRLLKQLDAKYIPIDNNTLNYDAATGKLCANTIFPNNLIITQNFGKYQAGEEIPAAGKSIIELFADALGDINYPKIEAEPKTWLEVDGLKESYEVGTAANLSWKLKFMPGKYTHGTVNENDSDIYVSKVRFYLKDSSAAAISLFVNKSEYSLTSEQPIEFDFEAPENGKYRYEEQLLLNGTLGIIATKPGKATIHTEIEYQRFEEDFAITGTGEIAEPPVSMQFPSSVGPFIVVTNEYNWYWGSDSTPREDKNFTNYQMGGFPETYETTQAQRWYFKVPEGQINSFELVNAKTGVVAGLVQKETTDGYDIYCITNACADKNTNLYEIHYTKNTETGGDTE